jgi:hypothetical protein
VVEPHGYQAESNSEGVLHNFFFCVPCASSTCAKTWSSGFGECRVQVVWSRRHSCRDENALHVGRMALSLFKRSGLGFGRLASVGVQLYSDILSDGCLFRFGGVCVSSHHLLHLYVSIMTYEQDYPRTYRIVTVPCCLSSCVRRLLAC